VSPHHAKTVFELRFAEVDLADEGISIRDRKDLEVDRPYGLVQLTQPNDMKWYAYMSDQHADARLIVSDVDPRRG
jgi:hypothetical protein